VGVIATRLQREENRRDGKKRQKERKIMEESVCERERDMTVGVVFSLGHVR